MNASLSKFRTRDFVRICLFAAFIAALGLLPKFNIPIAAGVPITAQTLGVMLAGVVLGPRNGALAVLLFVFIVALGMPLLAGGRGGLGVFAGPSGGFILGWIPGAWLAGYLMQQIQLANIGLRAFLASIVGGIIIVYAIGIPWLSFAAKMPMETAALAVSVFIPGDLLKAAIVGVIAAALPRDQLHIGS